MIPGTGRIAIGVPYGMTPSRAIHVRDDNCPCWSAILKPEFSRLAIYTQKAALPDRSFAKITIARDKIQLNSAPRKPRATVAQQKAEDAVLGETTTVARSGD